MKVNIRFLSLALFRTERLLDLDTGETCSVYLIKEGLIEKPKRYRELPMYSVARVYQQYLNMLFSDYAIEDIHGLSKYPEFPEIRDPKNKTEYEYIDKAYYYVIDLEDGMYLSDNQKATLPDFNAYYNDFTLRTAKEWCKKEGYEWHEE